MNQHSKLTALTMSLPSKYVKGSMEIEEDEAEKLLKEAYKNNIKSFIAAPQYLMGKCEEFVGRILKEVRNEISLSTIFPFFDPTLPKENPVRFSLEKALHALQTDYVDCLYFYGHFVQAQQLQEAKEARESGKIRHVGIILKPFELPNAEDIMRSAPGVIDTIMTYFVPAVPGQLEMLSMLKKKGIRIVAAGLLDSGSDILPDELSSTEEGLQNISATEIAARHFLQQEALDEVIFILKDKEFLDLVCDCEKTIDKYAPSQLAPYFQEIEAVPDQPKIICSSCGYCGPCPKGIDISRVFNIYAYYEQYAMRDSAIYSFLNYQSQLGDRIENVCTSCGVCEKRCPQGTPIMSNLKELETFMDRLSVHPKY